jgi:hypothetical protein
MKGKLIKTDVNYLLEDDKGLVIASTSTKEGINGLTKKNCDEIFGVVDLMKLAEENSHKYYDVKTTDWHCNYNGFFSGFQKAMELNKDKLFTVEELRYAFYTGMKHGSEGGIMFGKALADEYVQSLQQPTEIEVEIEMFTPAATYGHSGWHEEPKLDENGCLILKKL